MSLFMGFNAVIIGSVALVTQILQMNTNYMYVFVRVDGWSNDFKVCPVDCGVSGYGFVLHIKYILW